MTKGRSVERRSIVFSVLMILFIIILFRIRYIVVISLIGVGMGVLMMPLLNTLEKKLHIPRPLSGVMVSLGLVLVLAVVGKILYSLSSDQISSLVKRWPSIVLNIENILVDIFARYPWLKGQLAQFDLGDTLRESVTNLFKGFRFLIIGAGLILFTLVLALYTAIGGDYYFNLLVELFPGGKRKKAAKVFLECAIALRKWFRAQLLDMMIIGFLTGVGLWMVGVEYWAIFGLFTSIFGIVPYLGMMMVILSSSLITLASGPSQLPWLLVVFLITQQLESNLILPLVLKKGAALPVVPLMIFIIILGSFFGVLGVFIAPALMTVLRVLYGELYLSRPLNSLEI